jgi:ABC-type dipeptide/oligopeptide/nickel transport system ATPase component
MTEGEIIEEGSVSAVLSEPRQEFTKALLDAATDLPRLDMDVGGSGARTSMM